MQNEKKHRLFRVAGRVKRRSTDHMYHWELFGLQAGRSVRGNKQRAEDGGNSAHTARSRGTRDHFESCRRSSANGQHESAAHGSHVQAARVHTGKRVLLWGTYKQPRQQQQQKKERECLLFSSSFLFVFVIFAHLHLTLSWRSCAFSVGVFPTITFSHFLSIYIYIYTLFICVPHFSI